MNPLGTIQPHDHSTFLERGVAVPFTTPMLRGTRVRLARNSGIELLVRNPSGGRGVYVMPWISIAPLCRPTLHDKVLYTKISGLECMTPATIRRVARETAAEGLAGEQAMRAAQTATAREMSDTKATNHQLLTALIRQVNVVPEVVHGSDKTDLDTRAHQTIAWLAPHLHQPITWAVGALSAIAAVMAGVGVAESDEAGRIPRLLSLLRQTRAEIDEWSKTSPPERLIASARMICAMADHTFSMATTEVAKTRDAMGDMVGLLRSWTMDPHEVANRAARPDWLLDGWEQICLIWNFAPDEANRRTAIAEIAGQVPVLPKEASDWSGNAFDPDLMTGAHRPLKLNEDWGTGAAVFDLIARNESFRAAAS